jgi:hypothetical protein
LVRSRKRAHEEIDDSELNETTIEEAIRKVTTPWSDMPYPEQVQHKDNIETITLLNIMFVFVEYSYSCAIE